MKILTIGRGEDADIRIEDDLVSRRHATIKLLPMGKMEIRDLSKNGTFVNGIRLAPNKPYPVTRKDVVSFARVCQLDWDEVPDTMRPWRLGALALLAVIVAFGIFALVRSITRDDKTPPAVTADPIEQTEPLPADTPREQPVEKKDSDAEKRADESAGNGKSTARLLEEIRQQEQDKKKKKDDKNKEKENKDDKKKEEPNIL